MLFSRFKEYNGIAGQFIAGKIYLVEEGYTYGATDRSHETVIDEAGMKFEIVPERNEFEFLDTVYGVWLGPPPVVKNWFTGDVKIIDQADDEMFRAEGKFLRSKLFEILDETNLHPDMFVLDLKSNKWEKILRVDDRNWISIESNSEILRPPTEFRFAVQNNAIVCIPLMFCIDDTGVALTKGKGYMLLGVNQNKWLVKDDTGATTEFLPDRFSPIPPQGVL